ncbi:MAG: ribonuclease H-like domain-containing protein [Candidatus Bipolaricaulota bacterium]
MNVEKLTDRLRNRLGKTTSKEYKNGQTFNRSPGKQSSGWCRGEQLKRRMLTRYQNTSFSEAVTSTVAETRYGQIPYREETECPLLEVGSASKQDLLGELQLLYGIGEIREDKLKKSGFDSLADLVDHPNWAESASALVETIQDAGAGELMDLITRWKPASGPLALALGGLLQAEDFAVFDIETLGLTHQPVIILGVAFPTQSCTRVRQLVLRDINQEPAALLEIFRLLDGKQAIITYNGKRFDIPYVNSRFRYYGIKKELKAINFDLYHFVLNLWGQELSSCGLNTVERKKLKITRSHDLPSSMVPNFYKTYREKDNPGPLIPILEHNKQDLLSLCVLYNELWNEMIRDA